MLQPPIISSALPGTVRERASGGTQRQHRDDIDGLRAVAVLPIVLFHAGLSAMSGGFTGVDIFFVISGFLITGIIARELDEGEFSLTRFYKRRVLRIVPALATMILLTSIAGFLLLLPTELDRLSGSAIAAALFTSNVYFWATTDYFSGAAQTVPLLHTWSLGVEEQFYIFYPLGLLVVRWLWPRSRTSLLIIGAGVSFAADLRWSLLGSITGFYMFPARAWQLLLGGFVALSSPWQPSLKVRQFIALIAVGLILVGLFTIDPNVLFPAPMALFPCGGTALLLAWGEGTWIAWLLTRPVMRWIGLISYSVYLWHWPIMAFMRLEWGLTLSGPLIISAIAASVAAGSVSYYFVEQPFRHRREWRRSWTIVGGLVVLTLVAAVAGTLPRLQRTLFPLDARFSNIAAYSRYYKTQAYIRQQRPHACFAMYADQLYDAKKCLHVMPGKHNILLIGDSHAAQYWLAITRRFPEANILQATSSGCLPQFNPSGDRWCVPVISAALRLAERDPRVDGIVFAARWRPEQVPALTVTVRRLVSDGVPVTVIGPINEYDGAFAELLARALLRGDPMRVSQFRVDGPVKLDRAMRQPITEAGARYYSVIEQECPRNHCRLIASDGSPFHTDYGHVAEGAAEDLMANLPTPWEDPRGNSRRTQSSGKEGLRR